MQRVPAAQPSFRQALLTALEEPDAQRCTEYVAPLTTRVGWCHFANRPDDEHVGAPDEGADTWTEVDRLVGAVERVWSPGPQLERLPRHVQLLRLLRRLGAGLQLLQQALAALPADRPAVVGVDQRQRFELVALVEVRDAGTRQLQEQLPQRDPPAERAETLDVGEQRAAVLLDPPLRIQVRLEPARVRLPSRSAFSTYASRRSGSSGQAPTTVWRTGYASFGSMPSPLDQANERRPAARRRATVLDPGDPSWSLVERALSSRARLAILPA